MNALNLGVMEDSPARFLRNLVTGTMSHRKNTGSRRNDLIDLLLDATQKNPDMDLDVIVATAMVLLIAGVFVRDFIKRTLSCHLEGNQKFN